MERLVEIWRRDADRLDAEAGTNAATQNKLKRARAGQLRDCAEELETVLQLLGRA